MIEEIDLQRFFNVEISGIPSKFLEDIFINF